MFIAGLGSGLNDGGMGDFLNWCRDEGCRGQDPTKRYIASDSPYCGCCPVMPESWDCVEVDIDGVRTYACKQNVDGTGAYPSQQACIDSPCSQP